jgi:hypothetical protein
MGIERENLSRQSLSRVFFCRSRISTAAGLAAAITMLVACHAQTAGFEPLGILFAAVLVWTAYAFGYLSLTFILGPRAGEYRDVHQCLLAGSLLVCVVGLAIKWFFPVSAVVLLLALGLIASIILSLLVINGDARARALSSDPMSAWAIVLASAMALLWCNGLLTPMVRDDHQVTLIPWIDYLVHADLMTLFDTGQAVANASSPELAGVPLPFYHYASYLIPAFARAFTGMESLNAVTAIGVPYAFLLMGLGAYALAQLWWGHWAGLLALVAVRFLPDASAYGLECSWFSYYWLLRTGSTLALGCALAALSLWLVILSTRYNCLRCLVAGLSAGLALVLVKAQLVLIVFPSLVLYALVFYGAASLSRRTLIGLVLAVIGLPLVYLAGTLELGPNLALNASALPEYTAWIAKDCANQALVGNLKPEGLINQLAVGSWIILAGSLGFSAPALFIMVSVDGLRGRLRPDALLPVTAVGIYLVLALLLEENTIGGRYELHHRPFVWVYYVTGIWVGGRIASLLLPGTVAATRAWVLHGAAALLLAITALTALHQPIPWLNRSPWMLNHLNTSYSADYFDAVRFVRENSAAEDLVQDSEGDPRAFTLAFSERVAYLARDRVLQVPERAAEMTRRRQQLDQLYAAETPEDAQRLARELAIDWLVLHPASAANWNAEMLERSSARFGDHYVYRFK